jgi:hypothetical protein
MKQWPSASELAEITGITTRGVRKRSAREGWERHVFEGRGGKEYRYRLDGLPEDVRAAYAASLNTTISPFKAP